MLLLLLLPNCDGLAVLLGLRAGSSTYLAMHADMHVGMYITVCQAVYFLHRGVGVGVGGVLVRFL
jgi:hypothetical protein